MSELDDKNIIPQIADEPNDSIEEGENVKVEEPIQSKKSTGTTDFFLGLAVSVITYYVLFSISVKFLFDQKTLLPGIVNIIVMIAAGFLCVRWFKTRQVAAFTIMILLLIPLLFIMLLTGGCGLIQSNR